MAHAVTISSDKPIILEAEVGVRLIEICLLVDGWYLKQDRYRTGVRRWSQGC